MCVRGPLQDLDEAVLRRFSRRVFVDLPDKPTRAAVLSVLLQHHSVAAEVDVDVLAADTAGLSGSDLKQVRMGAIEPHICVGRLAKASVRPSQP